VADTGDGFNPTYSIAWPTAQKKLAMKDSTSSSLGSTCSFWAAAGSTPRPRPTSTTTASGICTWLLAVGD